MGERKMNHRAQVLTQGPRARAVFKNMGSADNVMLAVFNFSLST